MTRKRFKLENPNSSLSNMNCGIKYGDKLLNFKEVVDLLNELWKENEQLKHQNKYLTGKRHQKISYRPYTKSKSDKELQEFLEQKVFNCTDR